MLRTNNAIDNEIAASHKQTIVKKRQSSLCGKFSTQSRRKKLAHPFFQYKQTLRRKQKPMSAWIWEGRWVMRVQCVSRLVLLPFYNINSTSMTNLINRNECRYTIKALTVNSRRGKPSSMFPFGMGACKVNAIISNHLLSLLWFFVFVGMKSCASFWKIMCLQLASSSSSASSSCVPQSFSSLRNFFRSLKSRLLISFETGTTLLVCSAK